MLFPASALFLLLAIVLFKIPRYQNAVVLSHSRLYVGQQINAHTQVFRGIAYANAPVARLRFSRPVPVTEQPGLTIARNYGPACPQKAKYALSNGISEDCLSLNIVRSSKRSKKAPVIVWIHGGNNNNGQSALYDGLSFVEASSNMGLPILFVTINYRLNGFGFLASNDLLQDGNVNLGLHDQNLALHWVQKHISAFGGNPEKVIVMGESAGAANTWSHLLRSSRSKAKLFHGAILISGSPGAVFPHADEVTWFEGAYQGLLQTTSCNDSYPVDCLREVDFEVLNGLFNPNCDHPKPWESQYKFATGIVQDGYWYNDTIWSTLQSFSSPIPIIAGCNLNEGLRMLDNITEDPDRQWLLEHITYAVGDADESWALTLLDTYSDLSTDSIMNTLKDNDDIKKSRNSLALAVRLHCSSVGTDLYFRAGIYHLLENSRKTGQKSWGFHFVQHPPYGSINLSYGYPGTSADETKRLGVYHGSSLSYIFGDVGTLPDAAEGDLRLSEYIINGFLSFAYELNPSTLSFSSQIWEQYSKSNAVISLQYGSHKRPEMTSNIFRKDSLELIKDKLQSKNQFYTPKS